MDNEQIPVDEAQPVGIQRPALPLPWPEAEALAGEVASELSEPNVALLTELIRLLGAERMRELLERTLSTEQAGGMATLDGARRRSPGGVFIYLAKGALTRQQRRPFAQRTPAPARAVPQREPFDYEQRQSYFEELSKEKGVAGTVKIVIVGRPARVLERGDVVMATMQNDRAPAVPKGLPTPPTPTNYLLYVPRKQWQKVAPSLDNPEDLLVVEGYPAYDSRLGVVSVFALTTSTKLLQAAKRAATAAGTGKSPAGEDQG